MYKGIFTSLLFLCSRLLLHQYFRLFRLCHMDVRARRDAPARLLSLCCSLHRYGGGPYLPDRFSRLRLLTFCRLHPFLPFPLVEGVPVLSSRLSAIFLRGPRDLDYFDSHLRGGCTGRRTPSSHPPRADVFRPATTAIMAPRRSFSPQVRQPFLQRRAA